MQMAWHESVFNGQYDRFTFPLFTTEGNEQEAQYIEDALRLAPGEQVLDLACGHGRHARLLSAQGFAVTGVDSNLRYLEMAKAKDPASTYLHIDLRNLNLESRFDAAYCFFSSFGYFDDAENYTVLRRMIAALKPGGRLLIDLQNRELFTSGEPLYQEFIEFDIDGDPAALLMNSTFDINSSRVTINQRLHHRGEVESMQFSMRLYTCAEMKWLLQQLGCSLVNCHGDTDASTYAVDSERMIIIARKSR